MVKMLAIVLALIGIWMIILGYRSDMLPPSLTGLGFIMIAGIHLFGQKKYDKK